ncbi:hypothetical protein TrRE_jg550, partial [Triparma retinervis]
NAIPGIISADPCIIGEGVGCDAAAEGNSYIIQLQKQSKERKKEYMSAGVMKYNLKNYPEVFAGHNDVMVLRSDGGFNVLPRPEVEALRREGVLEIRNIENDPTVKPYYAYKGDGGGGTKGGGEGAVQGDDEQKEQKEQREQKEEKVEAIESNKEEELRGEGDVLPKKEGEVGASSIVLQTLLSPGVMVGNVESERASIDFKDPGKDIFLAYVVFSLGAGVKGWLDGWRPSGWEKGDKEL